MKSKKVMLIVFCLAMGFVYNSIIVNAQAMPPATPAQPVNDTIWDFLPEVVVSVGKENISKEKFIKDLKQVMQMSRMQMGTLQGDKAQKFAKDIAVKMIDRMVLIELAAKAGYKGTPEMVLENFDKMLKEIPPQQIAMFKKQLESQGKTVESYREEVKNKKDAQEMIAIDKFVKEKVSPTVPVNDEKIKAFYEENKTKYFLTKEKIKASHILITPEGAKRGDMSGVTDEAKKVAEAKANDLLKQLKNGADFAELATANSACPSKAKGGSLGEFGKGQMDPTFEKASLALKKDELSGVVSTQFGYHIIKGGGIVPGGSVPLDDKLKERIKQNLQQGLIQKALDTLVTAEKANLDIKNNIQ